MGQKEGFEGRGGRGKEDRLRGKGSGCSSRREHTKLLFMFYFGRGSMVRTLEKHCVLVRDVLPCLSPLAFLS